MPIAISHVAPFPFLAPWAKSAYMNLRSWGILPGYWGRSGWHQASESVCRSILQAMGVGGEEAVAAVEDDGASCEAAVAAAEGASGASGIPRYVGTRVLAQGDSAFVDSPSELRLEDGTIRRADAYLPRDLPLGYHELVSQESGERTRVIVTPRRCHLPERLKTWGWAVQLYAVESRQSWGIGDLGDLKELGRWSTKDLGAGMLLINPLHAPTPTLPQQPSPYYPSSRLYRNPIYLRIEHVPGAEAIGPLLATLRAATIHPNRHEKGVDRDVVFAAKMQALEQLWSRFASDARFDAYRQKEGAALETYATFCALVENHGPPWQRWPTEYRNPASHEVRSFAEHHRDRTRFHQWLQWLIDEQLADAARETRLIGDLAVGIDPSGADAWAWQDLFAQGIEVGAPPDEFNTQGQKWGILPFVPWQLGATGYEPFARVVRSALRHMGGVRLDHVMGLFRLFWVPLGYGAKEGAYVRYPALDLLDIVALESQRAGAYIVGEDLGTVEDEVRLELAFRKILSYRVMWFEQSTPKSYPVQALATVTTHDLPTIAGLWDGSDLEAQLHIGLKPNREGTEALRRRLGATAGVAHDAPIDEVVLRTHRALAEAPSSLLAATLEDALGFERRPNMPGTTTEYPCWCIPLPKPLEDIKDDPRTRQIADALRRGEGDPPAPPAPPSPQPPPPATTHRD